MARPTRRDAYTRTQTTHGSRPVSDIAGNRPSETRRQDSTGIPLHTSLVRLSQQQAHITLHHCLLYGNTDPTSSYRAQRTSKACVSSSLASIGSHICQRLITRARDLRVRRLDIPIMRQRRKRTAFRCIIRVILNGSFHNTAAPSKTYPFRSNWNRKRGRSPQSCDARGHTQSENGQLSTTVRESTCLTLNVGRQPEGVWNGLASPAKHQNGLRWRPRLLAEVGVRRAEHVRVLCKQGVRLRFVGWIALRSTGRTQVKQAGQRCRVADQCDAQRYRHQVETVCRPKLLMPRREHSGR